MRLAYHLLVALPLAACTAGRNPLTAVAPGVLGFDGGRLARIDSAFQREVDQGRIAGAVVLVMRDGNTVVERAYGWADKEAERRMTTDAIFRIASQTKALTSVAIMMLAEEGRLGLNDPVSRFIPAYASTTVRDSDGRIVAARRRITVRDLLTHTAGVSYGYDSALVASYNAKDLGPTSTRPGWYTADRAEPVCATMERLASLPFAQQPGARFVYGYSTDILGCVVERASGMPLDRFIATRITGPLDMKDTHFFLPESKRGRLTAVYASREDTTAARAPDTPMGQGDYLVGPRQSFSGGAGLLSTARDYARFLEALRRRGELDGARILAPATVRLMTSNQVDTLFSNRGEGFGLGFSIVDRAGANGRIESPGTFGWGGAYGSQYAVDPAEGLVLVMMIQQIPNRSSIASRFPVLVYQALVGARRE
ncbi:MAG TPA: serine hydrolase domain-containing protein [Gemmatimonadaceae bacterium]|nr:serine hydrolase domain-containing protein [Gemmatimonadaceae bacterium]